jgi:hypothetical protein
VLGTTRRLEIVEKLVFVIVVVCRVVVLRERTIPNCGAPTAPAHSLTELTSNAARLTSDVNAERALSPPSEAMRSCR